MAVEIPSPPRALDTLAGWAILLARTQKPEQAVELLGLIQNYSAAEHEVIDRTDKPLASLKNVLPANVLDSAPQRQSTSTWEELAGELLGKPV